MLIRGLVFLSVAGLLLVACGDKEDDTGADAVQATDTADDDSAVE
jgi:major membrane immunogen (membrane-anchored lipoprotein)